MTDTSSTPGARSPETLFVRRSADNPKPASQSLGGLQLPSNRGWCHCRRGFHVAVTVFIPVKLPVLICRAERLPRLLCVPQIPLAYLVLSHQTLLGRTSCDHNSCQQQKTGAIGNSVIHRVPFRLVPLSLSSRGDPSPPRMTESLGSLHPVLRKSHNSLEETAADDDETNDGGRVSDDVACSRWWTDVGLTPSSKPTSRPLRWSHHTSSGGLAGLTDAALISVSKGSRISSLATQRRRARSAKRAPTLDTARSSLIARTARDTVDRRVHHSTNLLKVLATTSDTTRQVTTPPRLARLQDERPLPLRGTCIKIVGKPIHPHNSQGGLAEDQPERTHKRPQTHSGVLTRRILPSSARSDQHATQSEVLPLREPTPLQPQHREKSIRPSRQHPLQKKVHRLNLYSRTASASFTNLSLNTTPSASKANTVSKFPVRSPTASKLSQNLLCAMPARAQRIRGVRQHRRHHRAANLRFVLPQTDSTEFTMPQALKIRRGGEQLSCQRPLRWRRQGLRQCPRSNPRSMHSAPQKKQARPSDDHCQEQHQSPVKVTKKSKRCQTSTFDNASTEIICFNRSLGPRVTDPDKR